MRHETTAGLPTGPLLLLLVVPLALLVLLPAGRALHRGRLGWAVAILLLSPWAGLAWWLVALRRRRPRA
ncbi:MAG: hypothetical protein ACXVEC_12350 [Nocardioides sp.]